MKYVSVEFLRESVFSRELTSPSVYTRSSPAKLIAYALIFPRMVILLSQAMLSPFFSLPSSSVRWGMTRDISKSMGAD